MKPANPITLAVALVSALLMTLAPRGLARGRDQDPRAQELQGSTPLVGAPDPRGDTANYARLVGGMVDRFWATLFIQNKVAYRTPRLIITTQDGAGGCGSYSLGTGPFYCSADGTIYLPRGYFSALVRGRQVTPGDFAPAYVMAHEWGHHVQALYGLQAMRDRELRKADATGRQTVSINYELQADCFAGTWARDVFGKGMLEKGDIEEAQTSALQIGDDNLGVELRHWGHGSSAQRMASFNQGFQSGNPSRCKLLSTEVQSPQRPAPGAQRTLAVGSYEVTLPPGSTVSRLQNGGFQIHQAGVTVHIGTWPSAKSGGASGQLTAAMQAWNLGVPLLPVGQRLTWPHRAPAGTIAVQPYQQNGGSGGMLHGLFLLHVGNGPTPEAIVIDVFSDGPSPSANDWTQLDQVVQGLAGTMVFKRPW